MKMFTKFIILGVCMTLTKTDLVTNLNTKQLNDGAENFVGIVPAELPLYFHGKSSYYFETNLKGTRDTGVIFCRNFNMELVSIEDEDENAFLNSTLVSLIGQEDISFWTSGMKSGDIWYWMATGKRLTYQNWGANEPRNSDCILIETLSPSVWIAYECTFECHIICEGSA